ncbi:MAG: hypothetical protein J7L71_00530, partial [Spirochaetaceae bacterium]|nr:hypothetical protein [Spirochaetaceae bacterium]
MVNQRLSAEFCGSFLTKKFWKGRVHSIYSKAVNLLHPSGYLVSIVNTLDQMSDYGLCLADFKLLLSGVESG